MKITTPTAEVGELRLVDQTDEGARLEVSVSLQNPNPFPLPLAINDYRVSVAGKTFFFREHVRRTLPAQGRQTLELAAALTTGEADLTGATYHVRGWVEYRRPGQLRRIMHDSGVPLPVVNYYTAGRLGQTSADQ